MVKKSLPVITQKDVLILKQLLEDGRKSSASISKEIDLGREIVNYRIKRLIKENLIVKFIPKINEIAMNYQEYIILLKLNLDDEVSRDEFIKDHIGNKYIIWIVKSESGWDLIVRLYAQSIDEFKEKLSEILESFSDVLANYYTIITSSEIKECENDIILDKLFKEKPKKDFKEIKTGVLPQLDEKDKEILGILQEDARIQYKEIGVQLDISSDTVKYRIDKMKSQGIIENIVPIINLTNLGLFQYACVLNFSYLGKEETALFNEYLKENSNIIRAIKSLNNDEFFITLAFGKENEVNSFKKEIENSFSSKIMDFDIFTIN